MQSLLLVLLAAPAGSLEWKPVEVTATPVALMPDGGVTLGPLTFKGAVELTSSSDTLGGLSGLRWWNGKLYGVSDKRGTLFRFTPTHDARGTLTAVTGTQAVTLDLGDAEALEFANGAMWVSNEDSTTLSSFPIANDLISATGTRSAMPTDGWNLGRNKGFEAMALASDCALVFSELNGLGFIGKPDALATAAPNLIALPWPVGFSPTDVTWVTPGKLAYAVLRRFDPQEGRAYGGLARLSMGDCSEKGFRLEVLTTWTAPVLVDNFEGLAVSSGAKLDTLFLVSDDNFKSKGPQRTLLLEFTTPR